MFKEVKLEIHCARGVLEEFKGEKNINKRVRHKLAFSQRCTLIS